MSTPLSENARAQTRQMNAEALSHYRRGEYGLAIDITKRCYDMAHSEFGERDPEVAQAVHNLAELYLATGDYKAAEASAHEAIALRAEIYGKNAYPYSASLTTLAKLYDETGNNARAEGLYEDVIAIRRESRDAEPSGFAESLNNLAVLVKNMGRLEQAEALFVEARDTWLKSSGARDPDYAASLNNLASLYRESGRFAEAERSYKEVIAIWREAFGDQSSQVAASLNNLAAVYQDQGHYDDAAQLYRQAARTWHRALGEDHPSYGQALLNLALVYAASRRGSEALPLMNQASSIDDRSLGRVFSFGSERHRLAYVERLTGHMYVYLSLVRDEFAEVASPVTRAYDLVLRRKAIVIQALAMQRDAILGGRYRHLQGQLSTLDDVRQRLASESWASMHGRERGRSSARLQELRTEEESLEAELAQKMPEFDLERRLSSANSAAVAAALPVGSVLVEFVRFVSYNFAAIPARGETYWQSARYAAFVLHARRSDAIELFDLGDAAAIDALVADFRSAITVKLTSTRKEQRATEERKRLASERSAGLSLRRMIFDPLVSAIKGSRELLLAPDGDLVLLPFAALPIDERRCLIDKYQISYLSTGRDTLRFGVPLSGSPGPPLVAADADFNLRVGLWERVMRQIRVRSRGIRSSPEATRDASGTARQDFIPWPVLRFDRLKETRTEGQQIGALLGVQPWLGSEVLESRIKSCRAPHILHVATHGAYLAPQKNDDAGRNKDEGPSNQTSAPSEGQIKGNPLIRSILALAGANTRPDLRPKEAEDGVLTALDASGLDLLDTELVVLSACETALGTVHVGEGVFGLRRSFELAGARTLIMSLWKVPDQATRELMYALYSGLLLPQPRAEALRAAQLALKCKYQKTRYWAAFICQGDPGPLLQSPSVNNAAS